MQITLGTQYIWVYYIGIPIPPPPTNKILRVYYIGISTCTEDVQYI